MHKILKNYNLKYLKTNIESYGYKFSIKDFMIETIFILSLIIVIAIISQLKLTSITILVIVTLIVIPILILSWFSQNYELKRFKMLVDYISNILPIFMHKTKVRFALNEVIDLTSGKMQKSIAKAIKYIDSNIDDVNVHKSALALIEKEFPNSRVRSVHKLMLTVEAESSSNYHDVCENLYIDIENWIKRVYTFQKDLKNRRNKLIVLCLITLILNCLFVYLYVSNEYFIGYTDVSLYQISTTIFIICILLTITAILTKLHGEWIVNDLDYVNETKINKAYDYMMKEKTKLALTDIIVAGICLMVGTIYFIFLNNYLIGLLAIFMAYVLINMRSIRYKKAFNTVKKYLEIEFPVWLREISLSLNNLTVINAIEHSKEMASYPLRQEIKKFIKDIKQDPTSIKPFTNFLVQYDLPDATSSMKVLYSIQNIGKNEVNEQISSLIIRNQEMLDKSEQIRNNESITNVEIIGYVPVVIFSFEMMCSMFVLFSHMMSKLSMAINL